MNFFATAAEHKNDFNDMDMALFLFLKVCIVLLSPDDLIICDFFCFDIRSPKASAPPSFAISIERDMRAELSGHEPGLCLYLRLDEGVGSVVHDACRHGDPTGGPADLDTALVGLSYHRPAQWAGCDLQPRLILLLFGGKKWRKNAGLNGCKGLGLIQKEHVGVVFCVLHFFQVNKNATHVFPPACPHVVPEADNFRRNGLPTSAISMNIAMQSVVLSAAASGSPRLRGRGSPGPTAAPPIFFAPLLSSCVGVFLAHFTASHLTCNIYTYSMEH